MNNKKKNITVAILLIILLIILKLFLGGPYLYNLLEELVSIFIILILISIIMMLIPLIFRLKNKKKISYKKGIKLCFLNSLVIYIVSVIPCINNIINTDIEVMMSFDPITFAKQLVIIFLIISIIYFFINKLIFIENKK